MDADKEDWSNSLEGGRGSLPHSLLPLCSSESWPVPPKLPYPTSGHQLKKNAGPTPLSSPSVATGSIRTPVRRITKTTMLPRDPVQVPWQERHCQVSEGFTYWADSP